MKATTEMVLAAPEPTPEYPNAPGGIEVVLGKPPQFGVETGRYGGPAGCRLCGWEIDRCPGSGYEPAIMHLRLKLLNRPPGGERDDLRPGNVDTVCICDHCVAWIQKVYAEAVIRVRDHIEVRARWPEGV